MSLIRAGLAACVVTLALSPATASAASAGAVAVDPGNGVCSTYANPPQPGLGTAKATGGVSCISTPSGAVSGTIYVCLRFLYVAELGQHIGWAGPCSAPQSFVWSNTRPTGVNASFTGTCAPSNVARSEVYVTFDNPDLGAISNESDPVPCA